MLLAYATSTHTGAPYPADPAMDYHHTTGTLTLMPNQTTALITVQTRPDNQYEPVETFVLNLTTVNSRHHWRWQCQQAPCWKPPARYYSQ